MATSSLLIFLFLILRITIQNRRRPPPLGAEFRRVVVLS